MRHSIIMMAILVWMAACVHQGAIIWKPDAFPTVWEYQAVLDTW